MENIYFTSLTMDHLPDLVSLANNKNVSKYLCSNFPYPYTKIDGRVFILMNQDLDQSKSSTAQNRAIIYNNDFIGCIGYFALKDVFSHTCELGYWIGEPYWNKQITTYVIGKFIEYIFTTTNFNKIQATVFEPNIPSRKVLLKNGFSAEGTVKKGAYKNDKYYDYVIYGLLREETKYKL